MYLSIMSDGVSDKNEINKVEMTTVHLYTLP